MIAILFYGMWAAVAYVVEKQLKLKTFRQRNGRYYTIMS